MADTTCDVLVAGSGAGGFAAALTARLHGLDVLMVEKEALFGGTTAYSAGVIWIPCNSHARSHGLADSPDRAVAYIQASAGNHFDRARAVAFVDHASQMLDFFETKTHVRYGLAPTWADYEPNLTGGVDGGRSLVPEPFDGRRLGELFERLRPPLETMMLFGGMMVGRNDLPHLFNMTRSVKSAVHVAGMVSRYGRDRLAHKRGTRLTNGNALLARMALSAREAGIPLWLSTPILSVQHEGERVTGAVVRRNGVETVIRARRGVVLACGGFPGDTSLKRAHYPHLAKGNAQHRSLPPPSNSGDGIRLAEAAGARFNADVAHPAAWTPVSLVPQADGSTRPFPHFIDRGKPGVIAVDRRGKRFVNESKSYHVFVPAMIEACRSDAETAAWIVADFTAIRRFGLGAVPPYPGRIAPYLASGYLKQGADLATLAKSAGIDPAGFTDTVMTYNAGAANGQDPLFGRGGDAYQRFNGGAGHGPNPCVAPLVSPPFFAVKVFPGDIGTFAGLSVDSQCRVLGTHGGPIAGLFAVGNDAASVMGGTYPGAGITIGPAMTFGYIAGLTLADNVSQGLSTTDPAHQSTVKPVF